MPGLLVTFSPALRHAFIVTSPRNYLLVFLTLTTLGGAVLAWNQHLEIIKLNAALQEKDLDAQLHQREFAPQLAAVQASADQKAAKLAAEASAKFVR